MGWQPKCERVAVRAASIGLIAMLLLTGSGQVSAGSYQRWAAVRYADTWTCHNCTPEPYNSAYNYYPGLDCTNYVSQVLHAGGYPYRGCCWMYWNLGYWYHAGTDSQTWTGAPHINRYFSNYPAEFVYRGWPTELIKCDIFLSDFPPLDDIPDHAAVIVGANGGLKDQHSPPRKRVAWDAFAPSGTRYWSVHVKW
jgi:hypothetical protein